MKRTAVLLDRDEEMLADLCRLRNTNNESAIIREALLVLWQKNFGQDIEKPITAAPAPAAHPEPAGKMIVLNRIPAESIGLSYVYGKCILPADGIEEKLQAAGWHDFRWRGGVLWGCPKGHDIECNIGEEKQEYTGEEVSD